MKLLIDKSIFTLLIFALTISFSNALKAENPAPSSVQATEKARVVAQTAEVLREPQIGADRVLLLVRGQSVEVLEKGPEFAKVKFWIEGEFSVEGFIPMAALSLGGQNIEVVEPQYFPEEKPTSSPVTDFPSFQGKDLILVPQEKSAQDKLPTSSKSKSETQNRKRREGPLQFAFSIRSGYGSQEEKLKTRHVTTGAPATDSFLKYKLSGLYIEPEFEGRYEFDSEWDFGGRLRYRAHIFRAQVGANNQNILDSRVQAQRHRVELEPFVAWKRKINSQIRIEPELAPSLAYEIFISNQLVDRDPANATRAGQPVILNDQGIAFRLSLRPKVYFPYDLSLSPEIGAWMFYLFSESPQVTTDANGQALPETRTIRTGKANGISPLSLFYGGQLEWRANALNLPLLKLLLHAKWETFERRYLGYGNRAGVATLDATSQTTLLSVGAGLNLEF